jgi:transcriptional regulator
LRLSEEEERQSFQEATQEQSHAPVPRTHRAMYIPASFRVDDPDVLDRFIDLYSFATLISVRGGVPFATHLPLLLDRERRVLLGHVARANPQAELVGDRAGDSGESLAIFQGPHAYISPAWYATAPAVPTWNYAAVHVYGPLEPLSAERTRELVDLTVDKYESTRPNPWPNDLPEDFRDKMLKGIVGFEMPIRRIEGKFKLGQNRSEADQHGMLSQLQSAGPGPRSLAEFIVRHRESIRP